MWSDCAARRSFVGNKAEEGKRLLAESDLAVITADNLAEEEKAVSAVQKKEKNMSVLINRKRASSVKGSLVLMVVDTQKPV